MNLLTPTEPLAAERDGRACARLCVLEDDALVAWWSRFAPPPPRHDPLVRYVADDFTQTISVGPYQLLERRGA